MADQLKRENEYREFFGDLTAVSGFHVPNPLNYDLTGDDAYVKNLLQIKVNPLLTRRNLYAYLWARDDGSSGGVFQFCGGRVTCHLHGEPVLKLNVAQLSGNLQVGGGNVFYRSIHSDVLNAATPLPDSRLIQLFNPIAKSGGGTQNEPSQIFLLPHPVDFQCDLITLEVAARFGTDITSMRALLIVKSL